MTPAECTRAWQAEAARDGRLSEADRASFERHAASCKACTRELRALIELADAAARLPTPSSTPLERRRLRNELLRRANELVVQARPSTFPARGFAAALAMFALVAASVWILRAPAPEPAIVQAPAPPSYRLDASEGAEWRLLEPGSSLRIDLRRGRLQLEVDKLRYGQRFVVNLPDGELEVQGTRFAVDVETAATRRVSVEEGRVALRLRDRAPIVLVAGDVWAPEVRRAAAPSPPLAEPARAASPVPVLPSASPAEGRRPQTRPSASPAEGRRPQTRPSASPAEGRRPQTRPSASPAEGRRPQTCPRAATPAPAASQPTVGAGSAATIVSPPGSGSGFAVAMSAFTVGDFARAEALFATFEAQHPNDARVEDSTFLRAVARSRRGDASGAQTLAREYLRRYPDGLRRKEAERLADGDAR